MVLCQIKLSMSNIYLFSRQVDKDCELLEQEGIMDYSLLLGIYFKDISPDVEIIPLQSRTPVGNFLTLYDVVYNLNA